ncbi:MAG: ABC transporter ATP-binding protein [Sarcina sp.]
MNAIQIKNLKKSFKNFTLNIDELSVQTGYITGFIGKNSSGKTTTIKLIMDMLTADSGDIKIFGNILKENEIEIKNQISYIGIHSGFPEDLKIKNIKQMIAPFYSNWDELLYEKYIKRFDLDVTKKYKDLSSGKRKQFELCMALSHKPKLLIMDEPTINLDPIIRNEFLEILSEHIETDNLSVFYSSHITSDLEKSADFIYFIDNGSIILAGEKDELLEMHKLIKAPLNLLNSQLEEKLIDLKKSSFGFTALTDDYLSIFELLGSEALYEKPTLEDLMLYYTKN